MEENTNNLSQNIIFRIAIFAASLSFFGAIIYLVWSLNAWACLLVLLLSISLQITLYGKAKKIEISKIKPKLFWLWIIILVGTEFLILRTSATTNSIVSPFSVIPQSFWLLLIPLIIILIIKSKNKSIIFFYGLFVLLILSISAIIYKIGFGFDPFIHLTAMEIIADKGFILPKTIYYSGQYGLILPFNKLLGINLDILNRFVLPILSALILPLTIKKSLRVKNKTIIIALILGFSFLTFLTPQNLGWLFLLITVLWTFSKQNKDYRYYIGLSIMALAAFFCQPLAGLPAIIIVTKEIILLYKKDQYKKILLGILYLSSVLIIPLIFIISKQGNFSEAMNLSLIKDFVRNIGLPNKQNIVLNFSYLYSFNKFIIFIALVIYGFLSRKNKDYSNIIIPGTLALGALISSSLDFSLISYEQNNFPIRLLTAAGIILSPLAILALNNLAKKVAKKDLLTKTSATIIVTIFICSAIYQSYPRYDRYFNSHSYSSSISDAKAIESIENKTKEPYIALANQQISVLALQKNKFTGYLKNDIFFYPLPTSGPLYQYYLKMVYQSPGKTTAIEAMDLVEVNEAYLILNNYWTDYKKIKVKAILEADDYWEIDDGKISVFQYKK